MKNNNPAEDGRYHDYEGFVSEEELAEIEAEIAKNESGYRPALGWIHAVSFWSFSKGRGRRRRNPKEVILIQWGGNGYWAQWTGEDQTDNGRHPWDVRAEEMLSEGRLAQLDTAGINPADWLTEEITQLLAQRGGRF